MKSFTNASLMILCVTFFGAGFLGVAQTAGAAGSRESSVSRGPDNETPDTEDLAGMPVSEAQAELQNRPVSERILRATGLSERALHESDLGRARAWAEYAANEALDSGSPRETAETWRSLALLYDVSGDLRSGIRATTVSASAFSEAGDLVSELEVLSIRANIEHRLGALADGIETASGIISRFGDQPLDDGFRADVLSNAAMMHFKLGRLDEIPGLLEDAADLYESIGSDDGLGTVYRIWGNYHGAIDDPQEAIMFYERAGERYSRTGNVFDAANVYFNTALMLMRVDEFEAAVSAFEEAITGFSRAGSASGTGMAATELTVALWELERYEEAEQTIQRAIAMLDASQSLRRLARARTILGTMYSARGSRDRAVEQLARARNLYDELGLAADASRIQREIERIDPGRRDGGI